VIESTGSLIGHNQDAEPFAELKMQQQQRDCSDDTSAKAGDHSRWQAAAACAAQDHWRSQAESRPKAKDATDADHTASADPEKPQEWTVAYYLGADKARLDRTAKTEDSRAHDVGGPEKAEQLKQIAKETKGKPVTALVDVLRETDQAHAARVERGKQGDPKAGDPSGKPSDYLVDHYRIRDGKVERMGTSQSQGMAADVEKLTHDAAQNDPSKKLGLVINGDGGGNRGQKSDSSTLTSNDDIRQSIQRGLNGSEHDLLDILNFDQCLMSQNGSLHSFKDVTKDIVASSESELAAPGFVDGQNLGAELHNLLEHPQMTGRQWGDDIVAQAEAGKNDVSLKPGEHKYVIDTGTPTLANIDPAKIQPLTDAIGQLGTQLKEAIADSGNRQAIEQIIQSLPQLGANPLDPQSYIDQKRDVASFTDGVRQAIKSGKISDPDGKLSQSLDAVAAAEKSAVTSYHGSAPGGYDRQGGISAYLPDQDFRDVDRTLGKKTGIFSAADILDNFKRLRGDPQIAAKDPEMIGAASSSYGLIMHSPAFKGLTPEQKAEAQPLIAALEHLRNDQTLADRQRDLDVAREAAHDLLHSPLQRQLIASMDHEAIRRAQSESRELELRADPKGWSDFINALEWRS